MIQLGSRENAEYKKSVYKKRRFRSKLKKNFLIYNYKYKEKTRKYFFFLNESVSTSHQKTPSLCPYVRPYRILPILIHNL